MVTSLIVDGNINVDDITVLNFSVIRNTVTDDFVDRRADTFGKVVVIQRRWVAATFDRGLMDDPVNLIRGYARPECLTSDIQHFTAHLAGMAETVFTVEFLFGVDTESRVGGPVLLF